MKRAATLIVCPLLLQGYIFSDYLGDINIQDFVNGLLLDHFFSDCRYSDAGCELYFLLVSFRKRIKLRICVFQSGLILLYIVWIRFLHSWAKYPVSSPAMYSLIADSLICLI